MSTKENREKEAKKLKYKKNWFLVKWWILVKLILEMEKNLQKNLFEHPMAEERFQQTARARLKNQDWKIQKLATQEQKLK